MAFPGSTFGLWLDEDCTIAFSGTLSFVHYTDLSDNPQDTVLYLGSTATNRELQATSSPGVDDITLTPTDTTPVWQASHAYAIGAIIKPTVANGFVYKAQSAGTSSASQPVWPVVGIGSTILDGGVLWALYAVHHPKTEIKLSLTEGGLPAATGGAPLAIAPVIESLAANAVPIYIRVTNTVVTTSNNTGNAEIGVYLNPVIEVGV